MPQRLDVRVFNPVPEPGVNLDLYQTLATEYAHGDTVTMWGPFVIARGDLRAVAAASPRSSNRARPATGPSAARDLLTGDCIHAVAAVDPVFGRGHYPLVRIGKPASRLHRPPGDDPEPLRPVPVRQLLADPPPRPRPLPDRGRPPAADPQARLRPLHDPRVASEPAVLTRTVAQVREPGRHLCECDTAGPAGPTRRPSLPFHHGRATP